MLFVGRGEEESRFRVVLSSLREGGLPDEGHVVLVHGLGGIGKSMLLARYVQIAAGDDLPAAGGGRRELLVARVDWEIEQRVRAADFALDGGPPVWVVLDRIYRALGGSVAGSKREAGLAERAFGSFRAQVTNLPELAEDVRRAFPGGESEKATTAADVEAVVQAIGRGAAAAGGPAAVLAAGPAVRGVVGAGHIARDAWGAVRQFRHGLVPEGAYRLVLRRVEELADTFARCLRKMSEHRPVMVVLDTCELIPGSHEYLRRVMRSSGSRVLWVVGLRLDPDADPAGQAAGEVARYRQAIDQSRLRVVGLSRFTDDAIGAYFDGELPGRLGADVGLGAVTRVTRGIPLAVALVCDLLKAGQDAEMALQPVPEPGMPSAVVRGLAERYLVHARACPPLRADVPLLYGLALLHSDRLDPDLLAALWDVDPAEVADIFTGLAARHDFVLRGSRRLHGDVRDAIRLHLLDDALRVAQRPMNERAAAHLSRRLSRLSLAGAEAQLGDQEWHSAATALLWHTFWVGNRAGMGLLAELLPAAGVLAEPFGMTLLDAARFFLPVLNDQDKRTVAAFSDLARLSLRQPRDADRADTSHDAQTALALQVLDEYRDPGGWVLATDVPRAVYLSLLKVKYARCTGGPAERALPALEHAAAALPAAAQPGATSRAIGQIAEGLADDLIFVTRWQARATREGLRAAGLATLHNPGSSTAWWLLAVASGELGYHEEDLAASNEAIRIDPGLALAHNSRGVALSQLGRPGEALEAYEQAVFLDPEYVVAQTNRGNLLTRFGRLGEALQACDTAILAGPGYAPARLTRIRVLRHLARFQDALEAADDFLAADPGSVRAHNERGLALESLSRSHDSLQAFDTAIRLAPADARSHANRSIPLQSLGRFHDALDACDTAAGLDPAGAWVQATRGYALQGLDRLQDALDAYDTAISIYPGYALPYTGRGECLMMLNRPDDAATALQQAIDRTTGDGLEPRVLLASILRITDPGKSARLARAALTDTGRFLSPFRRAELTAIAHLLLGDPDSALAELLAAAPARSPRDLFERPLYDLLAAPPVTGLHLIMAAWEKIDL
jgi:tetratricopeptide (TPR) repeat protein